MTLLETLQQLGITDITVLPDKTQRKLKEYNRTLTNPIGKNRKTGELHPKTKIRLDDLAEDIIIEAKLYIKKSQTPPPPSEPTEAEKAAAEAERKRKEEADAEAERQRLEAEAKKNKKGGLESFLGW